MHPDVVGRVVYARVDHECALKHCQWKQNGMTSEAPYRGRASSHDAEQYLSVALDGGGGRVDEDAIERRKCKRADQAFCGGGKARIGAKRSRKQDGRRRKHGDEE